MTAHVRWFMGLMLAVATAAPGADGVPAERLQRLSQGVNLSHWLWLPQGKTEEERGAWFGAGEARALRELGVSHVRLPFEPDRVWDRGTGAMREEGCKELERAVALCVEAGLGVVVDAHPTAGPWMQPDQATGGFKELEALWGALAARLAPSDPERVFLEILNEPHDLKDPATWPAAQQRLVGVIRAAAPRHTIMATGDGWGSIDGLLRLKPVADGNVVYSFHFYEPHDFTHQGATWGAAHWRHLKGLPYPSSPEVVEAAVNRIADSHAAAAARRYGRQRWGAERIAEQVKKPAAWAKEHGVPVYCGEFGAYKEVSPRESRLAWIRDVAGALREEKIGWSMWDYAGGFALMEGKPGARTSDAGVVAALRLEPRP